MPIFYGGGRVAAAIELTVARPVQRIEAGRQRTVRCVPQPVPPTGHRVTRDGTTETSHGTNDFEPALDSAPRDRPALSRQVSSEQGFLVGSDRSGIFEASPVHGDCSTE